MSEKQFTLTGSEEDFYFILEGLHREAWTINANAKAIKDPARKTSWEEKYKRISALILRVEEILGVNPEEYYP